MLRESLISLYTYAGFAISGFYLEVLRRRVRTMDEGGKSRHSCRYVFMWYLHCIGLSFFDDPHHVRRAHRCTLGLGAAHSLRHPSVGSSRYRCEFVCNRGFARVLKYWSDVGCGIHAEDASFDWIVRLAYVCPPGSRAIEPYCSLKPCLSAMALLDTFQPEGLELVGVLSDSLSLCVCVCVCVCVRVSAGRLSWAFG